MKWQLYRVVYRLKSNLHIGWRKIGNLMQTRHYIPSRTWHGATTSLLTQHLGKHDYLDVGDFVHKHLIFSYFFFATDKENPLIPCWQEGHITYGLPEKKTIPSNEFEYRFIKSQASTAIDTQSNTSLEGQLYEVEYIVPYIQETEAIKPVFVVGHLFVRAHNEQVVCEENDVLVQGKALFGEVLRRSQVGGERRYGFGMLELQEWSQCTEVFGYNNIALEDKYPILTIPAKKPVLAHLHVKGNLNIHGTLEPLVGREWHQSKGPGNQLSQAVVCFAPGATLTSTPATFQIGPLGIWEILL